MPCRAAGIVPAVPADTRARLLITPDRDDTEAAAEAVLDAGLATAPPRVVREALAGEDDAEDAQWPAIVPAPDAGWSAADLEALAGIAAEYEGWIEIEH